MAGTITEFFGYRETHGHRAKRYGHIAFLPTTGGFALSAAR